MEYGPILTAALAALAGIVSSVITIVASRGKNKADAAQTEANADVRSSEGFKLLTEKLAEERVYLTAVIEKQAGKIEQQSLQIGQQNLEIGKLQLQVSDFERKLNDVLERWRSGEAPPPAEAKGNRA